MTCEPFTPPCAFSDLPGIGGRIGPEPEDFRVEEVPLYPARGEGPHHFVELEKRALTTERLIRDVARAAGVPAREIGSAGMKDKHAVTTQWLSVPATAKVPPEDWRLPDGIRLLRATRHDNKLRTGHLIANRFRIRIVDVEPDPFETDARIATLSSAFGRGLPNFFGVQRFGFAGGNLAKALEWAKSGARSKGRFENKLYPSVIQSDVFNRYLHLRLERGRDRLIEGEVVRLDGSGAHFVVLDVEREQPRLGAQDIHLTGPIFGPKMKPATGAALELERSALRATGVDDPLARVLERHAPGTRRDLLVAVDDLRCERVGADVVLGFTLPAGSYATGLVREFTRQPFFGNMREQRS